MDIFEVPSITGLTTYQVYFNSDIPLVDLSQIKGMVKVLPKQRIDGPYIVCGNFEFSSLKEALEKVENERT